MTVGCYKAEFDHIKLIDTDPTEAVVYYTGPLGEAIKHASLYLGSAGYRNAVFVYKGHFYGSMEDIG